MCVCVCNLVLWWGTKTNKRNRDSCCAFTLAFKRRRRWRPETEGGYIARPKTANLLTDHHPSWLLDRRGGGGGNLNSSKVKSCAFFASFSPHFARRANFLTGWAWGYNGQLTLKREPLTKSTCGHWSVKGWSYIGIFHRDENPPIWKLLDLDFITDQCSSCQRRPVKDWLNAISFVCFLWSHNFTKNCWAGFFIIVLEPGGQGSSNFFFHFISAYSNGGFTFILF